MRVQIIMPEELVKKIDETAKSLNVSRSAFMCMSLSQKLQQDSVLTCLPEMMDFMKKSIKENGLLITESKEQNEAK